MPWSAYDEGRKNEVERGVRGGETGSWSEKAVGRDARLLRMEESSGETPEASAPPPRDLAFVEERERLTYTTVSRAAEWMSSCVGRKWTRREVGAGNGGGCSATSGLEPGASKGTTVKG